MNKILTSACLAFGMVIVMIGLPSFNGQGSFTCIKQDPSDGRVMPKCNKIRCNPQANKTGCESFPSEICTRQNDDTFECDCKATYTRDVANRTFFCLEIAKSVKVAISFPNLKYTDAYKDKSSGPFMELQAEIWFKILTYLARENIPILTIDLISAMQWRGGTGRAGTLANLNFMFSQSFKESQLLGHLSSYFDRDASEKFSGGKVLSIIGEPKSCFRQGKARLCNEDEVCDIKLKKCVCRDGKIHNTATGYCEGVVKKMSFIISIPKNPFDSNFISAGAAVLESQLLDVVSEFANVMQIKLKAVIPGTEGILAEVMIYLSDDISIQEIRNAIEAGLREASHIDLHDAVVFNVEDVSLKCSFNDCPVNSECVIEKNRKKCQCSGRGVANSYSGQCENGLKSYTALIDLDVPYLSSYMDPASNDYYTLARSIEMETYSMLSVNDSSYHAAKVVMLLPGIKGTFTKLQLYSKKIYQAANIQSYMTSAIDEARPSSLLKFATIVDINDDNDEITSCEVGSNVGCDIAKRLVCSVTSRGINRCQCPLGLVKNFVTKECEVPYVTFHAELLLQIPWSHAYESSESEEYKLLAQKYEIGFFKKLVEKESNIIGIKLLSIMPSAFFDIDNEFLSFAGFSIYLNKFAESEPKLLLSMLKLAIKDMNQNLLFKNSQVMSTQGPTPNCVPASRADVCSNYETCNYDGLCECKPGMEKHVYRGKCERVFTQYQVLLTLDVPYISSFSVSRSADFKTLTRILETEMNAQLATKSESFISSHIEAIIPLGMEHLIISAILSYKDNVPFSPVLRSIEISISESQSLKLLSNSEIILLTGPPVYCYDPLNNLGCENMADSVCTATSTSSDFGECKCRLGTHLNPISETCTKIHSSIRIKIEAHGRYVALFDNPKTLAYQTFKKAFDITLFDALYADRVETIGVALKQLQGDYKGRSNKLTYTLEIYFNQTINQTNLIQVLTAMMKSTKFPMFKDGALVTINDVDRDSYMAQLSKSPSKLSSDSIIRHGVLTTDLDKPRKKLGENLVGEFKEQEKWLETLSRRSNGTSDNHKLLSSLLVDQRGEGLFSVENNSQPNTVAATHTTPTQAWSWADLERNMMQGIVETNYNSSTSIEESEAEKAPQPYNLTTEGAPVNVNEVKVVGTHEQVVADAIEMDQPQSTTLHIEGEGMQQSQEDIEVDRRRTDWKKYYGPAPQLITADPALTIPIDGSSPWGSETIEFNFGTNPKSTTVSESLGEPTDKTEFNVKPYEDFREELLVGELINTANSTGPTTSMPFENTESSSRMITEITDKSFIKVTDSFVNMTKSSITTTLAGSTVYNNVKINVSKDIGNAIDQTLNADDILNQFPWSIKEISGSGSIPKSSMINVCLVISCIFLYKLVNFL